MGCACGKPTKTQPSSRPQFSKVKISPDRLKPKANDPLEVRSSSKVFSELEQRAVSKVVLVPPKQNNIKQQSAGHNTPAELPLSISEQPPAIYAEALKQLKSPQGEPEELRSALRRSPSRRSAVPKTYTSAADDLSKGLAKNLEGIETRKIYHLKSSSELPDQRSTLAKVRKSVSGTAENGLLKHAFVGASNSTGPKLALKGKPIFGNNQTPISTGEVVHLEQRGSLGKTTPAGDLQTKDSPGEELKDQPAQSILKKGLSKSRSGKQLTFNLPCGPLSAVRQSKVSLSGKRLSLYSRGSGEIIVPFDGQISMPRLARNRGNVNFDLKALELDLSPVHKSQALKFSENEDSFFKLKRASGLEPTDRNTGGLTKESQPAQGSWKQLDKHQADQQLTLSHFHPLKLTAKHQVMVSLYDIRKPSLASSRFDAPAVKVVDRNLQSGGNLTDKMPQRTSQQSHKQVVLSSCSSEEVNKAFNKALDQGHLNDHRPHFTQDSSAKRKSVRGRNCFNPSKT